ncbi:thio(seleno)oxazole modification radical SAM maturase SbtM [Desulfobulbus alkaliphilus]|uniref:thio(seleno)oxazole modification radical SAM maturase SbtM n=1 Tax=Desulfobulbus alkaliphilus TaxID=869814 RepID=UPI001966AB60|nr:selenobiotic family peptide radical SAM maturase [Desulfobulbus alkaliphilus]
MNESLAVVFPVSFRLAVTRPPALAPADFPAYLAAHPLDHALHPYLPELATLELARHQLNSAPEVEPCGVEKYTINPTVQLVEVGWTGLPAFLTDQTVQPRKEKALVLVYRPGPRDAALIRTPDGHDLLALKIIMEGLDTREVAREAGVTVGRIDGILAAAVHKGLILAPPSSLVRDLSVQENPSGEPWPKRVATFALQWHLTQACDLHCRHCYDRTSRQEMEFSQALHVLDQLYAFSRAHHVDAQVSFSGGNPLLYPFFYELYQEAVDRGFLVAILGNPMEERHIQRLVEIKRPEFFQVSLEGLREHNDYIRGEGHFDRTLAFLDQLRSYGIYSMVMLTLTRANCDEVLALADMLRDRTDLFTFNRLAMVGKGAELASVEIDRFPKFLEAYLAAAENNACLSLKDSLFNLHLAERNRPLTGGCTGFGCGAAFNFVSVLPDGEVHACRKFPSPIGNIYSQSLSDIHAGEPARKYRAGSSACQACQLHSVCRGCAAVAHGFGLNVFTDRDPYCFKAH